MNDDDLEMTPEEKASLAASRAAVDDLATAIVQGADPEEAAAALAAARQATARLDREALLNKIHMPDTAAGEVGGTPLLLRHLRVDRRGGSAADG